MWKDENMSTSYIFRVKLLRYYRPISSQILFSLFISFFSCSLSLSFSCSLPIGLFLFLSLSFSLYLFLVISHSIIIQSAWSSYFTIYSRKHRRINISVRHSYICTYSSCYNVYKFMFCSLSSWQC